MESGNQNLEGGGEGTSESPRNKMPSSVLPINWEKFQQFQRELAGSGSPGSPSSPPEPNTALPGVNNEYGTIPRGVPTVVFGPNIGLQRRQDSHPNNPNPFRSNHVIGSQQHPKRGRGRPKGSKNKPKEPGLALKQIRKKVKTANYFDFKNYVGIPPPPIVNKVPPPPLPQPAQACVYVEDVGPPPLPLQLPPPPLGHQFSWNSIPEQCNGGGTPNSNLPRQNTFVEPNQFQQFNLLPNPNLAASYYDCSHLYERFKQAMGKYFHLNRSETEADILLAFEEASHLFIHDPELLGQISRFVSCQISRIFGPGMFNVVSLQPMSGPREPNIDYEVEVVTSSPSIGIPSAPNISEDAYGRTDNGNSNSNFACLNNQVTSCDVNSMEHMESLDERVKKRLSNDPERYDQYLAITANFIEFLKGLGTSPQPHLKAAMERQRVLERHLELLKNEPDLLDALRHSFLTNRFYVAAEAESPEDPPSNNPQSHSDINPAIQQEHNVVADEVQLPETETEVMVVKDNDTDTSRSPNQNTMESDPNLVELSSAPLLPDLRCHESAASELLLIDRTVIIQRIKDHPSLFDFCPSTYNKENEFMQMLDDRVNAILAEDLDQDKWKRTILDTLSYVFERSPSFRDPIEELLASHGLITAKKGTSTPFCAQISSNFHTLSLVSLDVSPSCSGGPGLCNEVLNDEFQFGIKPSATLFKRPIRTEKELILDTVEDARYEVDMMLYMIESTIAALERALRRMLKMSQAGLDSYQMDDDDWDEQGTVAYKKSIEWFYNGERVLIGLQKFPTLFVPRVLETLKMNNKEWVRMRSKWNVIFEREMERAEV